MKKMIIFVLMIGIGFVSSLFMKVQGQLNYYGLEEKDTKHPYDTTYKSDKDKNTNMQELLKDNTLGESDEKTGILNSLLDTFKIGNDKYKGAPKFILYVKTLINIALGLLSFVALLMTIYTFYMMFFTENEAGQKKAKGTLIGIFIAIAMIGIARLVVSFIFWWYQDNWKNAEDKLSQYTTSYNN